ncbi:MAG: aminoglycoside phosphotransferase family protein [Halioglobus sp.]
MSPRPIPSELLPWALTVLQSSDAGESPESALTLVTGDASNRRYFRLVCADKSYIVADAPPETEKNSEFVAIHRVLSNAGVRVPHLFAADIDRGYLLLEDLGDHSLLPALNENSVDAWYEKAQGILRKMAAVDLGSVDAAYDHALFSEELSRFGEWFVTGLLNYTLSDSEREIISRFSSVLLESALEQPQVLVHRDFHSRNLMILEDGELVIIDFQDAVRGPITYDIASLLKDCYIRWPQAQVEAWALAYKRQLDGWVNLQGLSDETFLRWFDAMALQRHIKVLGTFARLYLRDGKAAYLADLPMVLGYIHETLDRYAVQEAAFAEFSEWFAETLAPRIALQSWSASS